MRISDEGRCAYVVGVDVPRHVTIGYQLAVDIATDLGVPPAVVDVDYADHVPLKNTQSMSNQRGDGAGFKPPALCTLDHLLYLLTCGSVPKEHC